MHAAIVITTDSQPSNPATKRSSTVPLQRDGYGAISARNVLSAACRQQLDDMLALAVKSGQLNAPYLRRGKREMECLNHDVFDVLLDRGRIRALIIQERTFWKDVRKGYTRLTKHYVMLTRQQRKLHAQELDTATCAKRAKNTSKLGELIGHYSGAKPVKCKSPGVTVEPAYKVLARDADGTLRSVFDGSAYRVGVWRSQAAAANHGGGFYFYWSEEDALNGMAANSTFAAAWTDGKALVLCEVEVAGRTIEYGLGKHAASRLRVLSALQTLQQPQVPDC